MHLIRPGVALFLLFVCAVLTGCIGTGRDFSLMSPAQEQAIGAREHPKVLQQFGGVYTDPKVRAYVQNVGRRVAAASDAPGENWSFWVLNSPIPNAMALPGGYVYVTRGLLAIINSEAELAGVLGHEIGHVTAHHTARRYTNAVGLGLGAAILGAVTGNSDLQSVAETGGALYLSSYSRDQEFEADDLGVRYLAAGGYDPFAEADMLNTLGVVTDLEARIAGKSTAYGFFSTHPKSPDRVARATEQAGKTKIERGARPRQRDAYLQAVNGLLYGDDPALGVVDGNTYWHGPLRFTFAVPDGYTLINTSSGVLAQGPQGSAMSLSGTRIAAGRDMRDYLVSDYAKSVSLSDVRALSMNGMEAATGRAQAEADGKTVDLRLVTVRYDNDTAYRFQFVSNPGSTAALDRQFLDIALSFRPITATEARLVPVRKIDVVSVRQGETVDDLARYMAVPAHQKERFLAINGLQAGDRVRPGQQVKIIVDGR